MPTIWNTYACIKPHTHSYLYTYIYLYVCECECMFHHGLSAARKIAKRIIASVSAWCEGIGLPHLLECPWYVVFNLHKLKQTTYNQKRKRTEKTKQKKKKRKFNEPKCMCANVCNCHINILVCKMFFIYSYAIHFIN